MSASSFDVSLSKDASVQEAARKLGEAARQRMPCEPVRGLLEGLGLEAAYAVQAILIETAEAEGRRVVGRKVGLTSETVRKQLGVGQPDYGVLLDDMACAEGEEISLSRLLQPKVEAEIAFVLSCDIDSERPSMGDVLNAIAYALPAIEIVDSRVRDWRISIHDTVADNASSGLYVLGGSPKKIDTLDLRLCGMSMERMGEPVSTGCGAACQGNPLHAVLWLAQVASRHGRPLRAGEVVLSGALGPMVSVRPGDVFEARISGLGQAAAMFSEVHHEC